MIMVFARIVDVQDTSKYNDTTVKVLTVYVVVVVGVEEALVGAAAVVAARAGLEHLSVGATFSLLPSTESEK